jgi:predicted anti-sigma-YlaC factor YlaD
VNTVANAITSGGDTYATEADPELAAAAAPFGLKTMESLLQEKPRHEGLLTALARGFTSYGFAFVQSRADAAELENRGEEARAHRERARQLYLRARDYGLRGLDVRRDGMGTRLRTVNEAAAALKTATKEDVPLLYWTAAAWALAISTAKDRMDLVAELPAPEAMMRRALELDEGYDQGAIHEFFVSFDASQDRPQAAKAHLDRALALSKNKKLGPLVSYAEGVLVQSQDRAAFTRTLEEVVRADVDVHPEFRLANVLAQRRARMLLAHQEDLFL